MRLRGEGFDASEDGTGRGTPIVPVAFAENQRNEIREMQVAGALSGIRRGDAKNETLLAQAWAVRRLTPQECEVLQGFPPGHTAVSGAADGPRYKALGNSFAVPVVRWIGERIAISEAINQIAAE